MSVTGGGLYGTEPGNQLVSLRIYGPAGGTIDNVRFDGEKIPIDDHVVDLDGRPAVTLAVSIDSRDDLDVTWSMTSGEGQTGDIELGHDPQRGARRQGRHVPERVSPSVNAVNAPESGSPAVTRILLSPPDVGTLEEDFVLRAIRSGWVAPAGPDLTAFEDEVAARVGASHAVGLSSGTAALHLALVSLGSRARRRRAGLHVHVRGHRQRRSVTSVQSRTSSTATRRPAT